MSDFPAPLPAPEEIDAMECTMRHLGLFDSAVVLQEIAKRRRAGAVLYRGETPFRGMLPLQEGE